MNNYHDIDWSIITTATGKAVHFPQAFANLRSDNQEVQEIGYRMIDNDAFVQAGLYEAAYYIVEPLLEILEDESVENKFLPLSLLTEVALGHADDDVIILKYENNEVVSLTKACQRKIKGYRDRIEALKLSTEKEESERQYILDEIEDYEV